jgi:hypothetical protein
MGGWPGGTAGGGSGSSSAEEEFAFAWGVGGDEESEWWYGASPRHPHPNNDRTNDQGKERSTEQGRAAGWGWGRSTWRAKEDVSSAVASLTSEVHASLRVLGLEQTRIPDAAALKSAYIRAVKQHHPDMHATGDVAAAAERFKSIQAAYRVLQPLT